MKKRLVLVTISIILVSSLTALAQIALFISTEEGKLKSSPNGETIVKLKQGTEVRALRTQGDWVRVSVEGWLHKDSITMDPEAIEEPKEEVKEDFSYENLELKSLHGTAQIKGKIKNQSGRDYSQITFVVNAYNNSGRKIGNGYITFRDFKDGEIKDFQTRLGARYSQVDSYEIKVQ
ncbi:FxLYD domain-containing protein [Fuchsiella alkaliacetigena]|uniref:FxLYD domain-containing protein n=1 Tax=Fuchsiella alkaliacetigena TaxID=957042 RepID=UPI00200B6184|nr:FxLYD domain-containing protein [Fuchsiella alkaliacetigena]MCK8824468.1 FxLYD domain-containing protein [Fuchsiella alkaliacetigena]